MRRLEAVDRDEPVWGRVPLDPSATSAPTSPAAQVATQQTQTANEAQRVAIAAPQLSPPPFVAPFVGQDGRVTTEWMAWLTRLYKRTGGAIVTPAIDMDVLTEFDNLPAHVQAQDAMEWPPTGAQASGALDWLQSQDALPPQPSQDAILLALLDPEGRGWVTRPAITAAAAASPAGGTGTAAGGWDTAANRDAAITLLNNLRQRLLDVEAALKAARILT